MHTPNSFHEGSIFNPIRCYYSLSDTWMLTNTACGRVKAMIFKRQRNAGVEVLTRKLIWQKIRSWTTGRWYLLMQVAGHCWPGSVFHLICRTVPTDPTEGIKREKSQNATIHTLDHNCNNWWHCKGSHLARQPVDFSPIKYQVLPHKLITARDWTHI